MTKAVGSSVPLSGSDFEVIKVFPFKGKDIVLAEKILDGKYMVLENYSDVLFESTEYSNCRRYVQLEFENRDIKF